ncbi:MAG: hypothetical protein LBQ60_18635 [Bacteroidales bacterium]|jgi:DUF4097 and DUF4098 domain-containing protein YvlB|nr:hypothetical protein [Bacteroidales bacterium]
MKRIYIVLISILLSANVSATSDIEQKDPYLTRTFPASSIKNVEASTAGGSITVDGNASGEAVVDVFVTHSNWSEEKIKDEFEKNHTLELEVKNGKLYVIAKRKGPSFGSSLSISFRIKVPGNTNCELSTSGGSIRISDLSGTQNFRTSGGSLNIKNLSGTTSGRTSGGSIQVSGSSDKIDLSTSGGSITATDCTGDISLNTSGGSLNLKNLNGKINAATSGGSVTANDITGTLKAGTSGGSMNLKSISGNLDARTSGGSMTVEMSLVSEYVQLSNSGRIEVSLPSGTGYQLKIRGSKIETNNLRNFNGSMETKSLEGTVLDGGPSINVSTSQRVSLSFK